MKITLPTPFFRKDISIERRAAQSAEAREQKWYLLPGTNQNVAGTIGKDRKKNEKNIFKILKSSDLRVYFSVSSVLCFSKYIFRGHCGIVLGFRRETSLKRTFLVACA